MNDYDANEAPRLLGGMTTMPISWKAEVVPRDRVSLEVVTRSGRAAHIEVRLRLELIEVWINGDHCCGVVGRAEFRAWLDASPRLPMVFDEVAFSIDRMVDTVGRVAISVPDVMVWPLSPTEQDELKRRV